MNQGRCGRSRGSLCGRSRPPTQPKDGLSDVEVWPGRNDMPYVLIRGSYRWDIPPPQECAPRASIFQKVLGTMPPTVVACPPHPRQTLELPPQNANHV